jgi:S1-C subfamily serine protease
MNRMFRIAPLAALLLAAAAPLAADDDPAVAAARALFKDKQDAVIWVRLVAKTELSAGGQNRELERQVEALGTVIRADGLTVVPYSAIDIAQRFRGHPTVQAQATNFSEIRLHLADGTEVPGRIALKDTDLDLAFVLPEDDSEQAEAVRFRPVDLSDDAEAEPMDRVIHLGRLSKDLDRRPLVLLGRVASVVRRPRVFYVATTGTLGGPVFTQAGKTLGLTVRHVVNGQPDRPVVLPAAAVRRIAAELRLENEAPAETPAPPEAGGAEATEPETDAAEGPAEPAAPPTDEPPADQPAPPADEPPAAPAPDPAEPMDD